MYVYYFGPTIVEAGPQKLSMMCGWKTGRNRKKPISCPPDERSRVLLSANVRFPVTSSDRNPSVVDSSVGRGDVGAPPPTPRKTALTGRV